MTIGIHSYCVATRTGPKPRHQVHILVDANEGKPLCGVGTVRFIGEPDQEMGMDWPLCPKCKARTPPDLLPGWLEPPWEAP